MVIAGAMILAAPDGFAQPDAGDAPGRPFSVVPSVSVNETYTNNAELSATNRRSDLISDVSPTLRVRSAAGHVQGSLEYALTGINYARGTESDTVQQSLNAAVNAQAFDDHALLGASANISRQNISALGARTPDANLRTANQTQVVSYDVNPRLQGHLGGFAAFQAGVNYASTHTGSDAIGDSSNTGESFHLGSDRSAALANWAIDLSRNGSDYSVGRHTTSESAVGSLILEPNPELQLSLRGGRDGDNYDTASLKNSPTYGGGIRWTPSERTTLSMQDDRRSFGNAYAIDFQHRTGQTVWTFSDTRSVNTDASAAAQGQLMTAFDLLYLQLTSKYPDPVTRANQALIELQTLGVNPLTIVPAGFLSNAATLQRNLTLSFAYLGLRTSFLVSAQQGDTSRLDTLSSSSDSLSNGNPIRQRSVALSASHRLTPQSSASLSFGDSESLDRVTRLRLALRTLSANWLAQLGAHTQMTLGARHSVSTGESAYTEWALLGSLTLQF